MKSLFTAIQSKKNIRRIPLLIVALWLGLASHAVTSHAVSCEVTATWNLHGTVSLHTKAGEAIVLVSGSSVHMDDCAGAKLTVDADYRINSVSMNGASPEEIEDIHIGEDSLKREYTLPDTFAQETLNIVVFFDHQITVTASGNGTVKHGSEGSEVSVSRTTEYIVANHEGDESFTFTPDLGSCVSEVQVNGESLGAFEGGDNSTSNLSGYTFTQVTDNQSLDVSFGSATVTVLLGEDDGLEGSADDLFVAANSLGWRAYLANASYAFDDSSPFASGVSGESFTIPTTDIGTCARYIVIRFMALNGWKTPDRIQLDLNTNFTDQQVTGLYDKNAHLLSITVQNGVVSRTPAGEASTGNQRYLYPQGTVVTLSAVPRPGWYFSHWSGDIGQVAARVGELTITMDKDRAINAVFVQPCTDNDKDGFTTASYGNECLASTQSDCDDSNPKIHPGALEICGDGIDQSCDGSDLVCEPDDADLDQDKDGYTPRLGDCDDNDPKVHPGAYDDPDTEANEDCYDGPKQKGTEITCVTPSDAPANTAITSAPPLITYLIDDSGSMDWEILVDHSSTEGRFNTVGSTYASYIFDVDVLQEVSISGSKTLLTAMERRMWQSQWSGHNRIYFNPNATYTPWPKWEKVIGVSSVRNGEKTYNPRAPSAAFPETAYPAGFTHADMDFPRLNSNSPNTYKFTHPDATKGAMYHPGGTGTPHDLNLNAEFSRVYDKSSSQQVVVTRTSSYKIHLTYDDHPTCMDHSACTDHSVCTKSDHSTCTNHSICHNESTYADAIGLSTSGDLQRDQGHPVANFLEGGSQADFRPEIIFDNSDSTIYSELGTWYDTAHLEYAWGGSGRFTDNFHRAAHWRLNLTAEQATKDLYVYAWVNNDQFSDSKASYTIYSYDTNNALIQTPVSINQPTNNGNNSPPWGARWVRLKDTPFTFHAQDNEAGKISVPNAHYYTKDDTGAVYLVTIPGSGYTVGSYSLQYYKVNDLNNNAVVDDGELTEVTGADIPDSIIPKRKDALGREITNQAELAYMVRQDFANWLSFYRKRILVAKAAIGLSVDDMERVELGLHTINSSVSMPLILIDKADGQAKIDFLSAVYNLQFDDHGTPLRQGLYDVGKYYEQGDSGDTPVLRTSGCVEEDEKDCTSEASSVFACADAGGECQRAYVIVLTDGYYKGQFSELADKFSKPDDKNIDANATYNSHAIFKDSVHSTLADIAMYFYASDLDSNLADKVPAKGYDNNPKQHLVTYAVAFGIKGNYDPNLFPDCLPSCKTPGLYGCPDLDDLKSLPWADYDKVPQPGPFPGVCPTWWQEDPNSGSVSPYRIDDLFHAAVNSRGAFLNASDPQELVAAMQTIKNLIINNEQSGTASSVTINANKIESNTLLFQATYDSSNWSGDLLAQCLDSAGLVTSCSAGSKTCAQGYTDCLVSCTTDSSCQAACTSAKATCLLDPPEVKWSASKQLAAVSANNRQIITANEQGKGIAFRFESLTPAMQSQLNMQSLGGSLILDYLRGDDTYERKKVSGTLRSRSGKLGDFINAEPLHYANTALGIDWVIAGSNDGMLHIFDGKTGEEVFAYIPQEVFKNLHLLSKEDYNNNHRFFVDGYITIQNLGAKVVLIGGLGKGGKGFFALDLTVAAEAHKNNTIEAKAGDIVLWEYTSAVLAEADAVIKNNLGYSFSRPQIVKSNDSSARWLLVFGNGYESINMHAALFTLGLDHAGAIQWTRVIDTGVGSKNESTSECNGLATPALLYPQGDEKDDFAYAGDLLGNLWKFDLSDSDKGNWNLYFEDSEGKKQPLFQARSSVGYRQPITMKPVIVSACPLDAKGYMVLFGTGRLLDPLQDFSDLSVQTVYGIWDWSAAWRTDQKQKFLGSFQPQSDTQTEECKSSCEDIWVHATTSSSCIPRCGNDAECVVECRKEYGSCITNCDAVRNLSNMDNPFVGLLHQTQLWAGGIKYNSKGQVEKMEYDSTDLDVYDQIARVLSNNRAEWYLPNANSNKTIKHLGWYFDLPANGERIVRDMSVASGKLIFTSTIPSNSPCEGGGLSYHWAVDACTGGRLRSALFDLNHDEIFDEHDYINIGSAKEPLWVAVSAVGVQGISPAPTVLDVEESVYARLLGEDGAGSSIDLKGTSIMYWRDLGWKP